MQQITYTDWCILLNFMRPNITRQKLKEFCLVKNIPISFSIIDNGGFISNMASAAIHTDNYKLIKYYGRKYGIHYHTFLWARTYGYERLQQIINIVDPRKRDGGNQTLVSFIGSGNLEHDRLIKKQVYRLERLEAITMPVFCLL